MYISKIIMDLKFPQFPVIFGWIESDYEKCKTLDDYINFFHICMRESEISKNKVRQQAYLGTAYAIYSKITGESYELNIQL